VKRTVLHSRRAGLVVPESCGSTNKCVYTWHICPILTLVKYEVPTNPTQPNQFVGIFVFFLFPPMKSAFFEGLFCSGTETHGVDKSVR
jgi:hypothetical protein